MPANFWVMNPDVISDVLRTAESYTRYHTVQFLIYGLVFGLMIWSLDATIKAALLVGGVRASGRMSLAALTPVLIYTLGTASLGHILLPDIHLPHHALIKLTRKETKHHLKGNRHGKDQRHIDQ